MGYIRAKQIIDKQMRGVAKERKSLTRMGDAHRTKIANSCILKYLIETVRGEREMTSTQAMIAMGLLKKVLPDVSQVTLSGDPSAPLQTRLTVSWEAVDVPSRARLADTAPERMIEYDPTTDK